MSTLTRSERVTLHGAAEPRGPRPTGGRILAYAALVVLAVVWLLPFVWAVNTSLKSETDASALPVSVFPPGGYTFEAYAKVLAAGDVPLWMLNSVVVAVAVTVLSLVVTTLVAYALSRLDFPGRKVVFVVIIASIMVPTQIFIIPLFDEMLALGLVDTWWGIILPQLIHPVMVLVLKRFFDEIPRELEDAALVDGCGRWRILWQIVVPLSRPVLAAVAVFVFIGAWNNFLWPFIVTNDPDLMTLPVGLQTVTPGNGVVYALKMAQAVLAALPLIVVFVFFQRQIIRSITTTGISGQ